MKSTPNRTSGQLVWARARNAAVGLAVALALAPATAAAQLAPEAAPELELTDWAGPMPGATDVVFMADGRAVVTVKGGEVVVVSPDGMMLKRQAASFMVDSSSEKGLLGVTRDDSGTLYFYASTGPDSPNKHEVWKAKLNADNTVTAEAKPLVAGGLEGPANHDGGGLVVYKGQLYISVGDTGSNATPPQNKYGACLNKPNGKILRVNLDGSIPADNPLSNLAMVTSCTAAVGGSFGMAPPDKRIFMWGFRNPWRFWFDDKTDLAWIGDVGEATEEEVTVGGKGSNHGWPFVEGNRRYTAPLGGLNDCKMMVPPTECVVPQDTYARGEAASVTGGLIPPAGCGWGSYENRYIFGDYNRHLVWTLDVKPDRTGAVPMSRKKLADIRNPVSFRQGPGGAVFVVSHNQGIVRKLAPKTVPAGCAASVMGGAGGAGGSGGAAGASGGTGGGAGVAPPSGRDAGRDQGGSTPTPAAGQDGDGCGCRIGAATPNRPSAAGLGALLVGLAAVSRQALRRRKKNARNPLTGTGFSHKSVPLSRE